MQAESNEEIKVQVLRLTASMFADSATQLSAIRNLYRIFLLYVDIDDKDARSIIIEQMKDIEKASDDKLAKAMAIRRHLDKQS